MLCLEKVDLAQTHFAKYIPFYAMWTYSSLFFCLNPQSEPNLFTNMFLSFKKTRRKNIWCSGLCQFFFCWGSSDIWWGLVLIAEMTAHSINCFLSHWSSAWLLELYQENILSFAYLWKSGSSKYIKSSFFNI